MTNPSTTFHNVRTSRLLLRAPTVDDADVVATIHGDPATNQYNPHGPASPAESAAMLAAWLTHWQTHGFGYWAVAMRSAPNVVVGFGSVTYKEILNNRSLNLYFRLSPSVWGQGVAVELGLAALSTAFAALPDEYVHGIVRVSNLPSRKVLERLGMTVVGEIPDVGGAGGGHEPSLVYRISRAQFNSTR